jgi:sirohydrochlorin ferrochelatase
MDDETEIFLVDNGSLAPEATLELRGLATALTEQTGRKVEAVSLLHSHKVDASKLGGIEATIVKRRMRASFAAGRRRFIILPLFLGPSRAITEYLPVLLGELRAECPEMEVLIANCLLGESVERPDARLVQILADHVRDADPEGAMQVALVDHGTPAREVNYLRNAVARDLEKLLGREVVACSMERRADAEYDFNEPLLEHLPSEPNFKGGRLLAAMFFLLPGRHAGAGGDVAQIGAELIQSGAYESVECTALLGRHPLLIEILAERLLEAGRRPA